MRARLALGALGGLLGVYGCYELLSQGFDNLVATVLWLAGGVAVHDGVVAFATVGVVAMGGLVVPRRLRAAVAAGFVVLGTVTVTAVPVLGRFGARPDNPSLLDRSYLEGWLLLAALVCTGSALVALLGGRRRPGSDEGKE